MVELKNVLEKRNLKYNKNNPVVPLDIEKGINKINNINNIPKSNEFIEKNKVADNAKQTVSTKCNKHFKRYDSTISVDSYIPGNNWYGLMITVIHGIYNIGCYFWG